MKKNTRVIAIVAILAVILLIVVGGLIYKKTDVLKSPNQLFYKYLAEGIGKEQKGYAEILEEYKKISEKSYSSESEISFKVETEDNDAQKVFDEINKLGVEVDTKSIPSEKKSNSNIKVNYGTDKIIEATVAKNDEKYGIKSDLLHEKYISVENNNLKKIFETLGIDSENIPNKIETVDLYDLLYIDKSDLEQIKNTYKNYLAEAFSKEKYSEEKEVETKLNGENIKVDAYKLTINEKDALTAVEKLLTTIENDDKTLDIIEEKIGKLNINQLLEEDQKINKETIKKAIAEAKSDVQDEMQTASDEEVQIIVYVQKGKLVKVSVKSEDEEIYLEKFEKNEKNYAVLKSDDGIEEERLAVIEYKATTDKTTNKLEMKVTIENEGEPLSVEYNITTTGKAGEGKNTVVMESIVSTDEVKIKMAVNSEVDYSAKVEIEDMDEENSIKLNDMSKEDMQELLQEVVQNLQSGIQKNESLLETIMSNMNTAMY